MTIPSQSRLYCMGILKLKGYVAVVTALIMEDWSLLTLRRQQRCMLALMLRYKAHILEHEC
jgi:hypothetical protein